MLNPNTITLLLIVVGIWLLTLTVMFFRFVYSIKKVFPVPNNKNIVDVLQDILRKIKKIDTDIEAINSEVSKIETLNNINIQKTGIVKFNPFNELGGSNSFSVALLDGYLTGIVITGLHARDKTRLYLKSIVKGKSDVTLSDEEERALKLAIKK